jgi:hypothetical protein
LVLGELAAEVLEESEVPKVVVVWAVAGLELVAEELEQELAGATVVVAFVLLHVLHHSR